MNKDRRKRLAEANEAVSEAQELINNARSIIEECRDEEQDYYDNMPESFQYGEKGEIAQQAIDCMEEAIDALDIDFDDIISNIDSAQE